LEDLRTHIKNSNFPKGAVISIGATSYTEFGENTFLEIGDEIFVVVYDKSKNNFDKIFELVKSGDLSLIKGSVLAQKII